VAQPALQDEPRRSRGVLGPSLAENRPKSDPEIQNRESAECRCVILSGALWAHCSGASRKCTRPRATAPARCKAGGQLAPPPSGAAASVWVPGGSLAGICRVGFRPIFGQTWPQNPSRTTGLVLQCRLHQKPAPQTNSKASLWRQEIPARLPSGTQSVVAAAVARC
jgi:hypothetical protein